MSLQWMHAALASAGDAEAIIADGQVLRYAALLERIEVLRASLRGWGLKRGDVLAFAGDYSVAGVTRFFAAVLEGLVAVPLAMSVGSELQSALQAAPADWYFPPDSPLDAPPQRRTAPGARTDHPLLLRLRQRDHAGIIILTSGSTGTPKVILHDAPGLLRKFDHPRRPYRALVFLLPDHMGGVNTLFGMLTCGSTAILPPSRDPDTVCSLVARHAATLLPVTPSFLNLLLISEAWRRHDLSSLEVVSYGTEPMPERTLVAAGKVLPGVRFVQLYGSSELGIFRGRAPASDSTFLELQGDGADFAVRDGRLWVRGADSMLGYLSGEDSGFGADGWYDTGDMVEQDGPYLRFLGRASQMINVGGQKVLPAEVEAALVELPGVLDAAAFGAPHVLTGQVVVARVTLQGDETAVAFKRRMRAALRGRLEPYKIPIRVELAETVISPRFKKLRR